MALLAPQISTVTGTAVTLAAATAGGDTMAPGSTSCLLVRNADVAAKTVTVVVPGNLYGQPIPDIPVVVAAGGTALIGPFPSEFAGSATGVLDITYSAVTSVTVAAIRFI